MLLLPVFFVLHGYSGNFGFIDGKDILRLLLLYSGGTVLLYLLLFLLYRKRAKGCCGYPVCCMAFFLFYGALTDFLKIHFAPAARYRVLLPLFFVLLMVLIFFYQKNQPPVFGYVSFSVTCFCVFTWWY